jgi:hypothetical protein
MKLNAGDTVTIKVKNPVWPMRKAYASYIHIPEFNTYTGRVVRDHRAIKPGQIGLTTDEPIFDLRVIDVERIVGVNDTVVTPLEKTEPTVKTWTVQGSKGKTYTVTLDHGRYDCSCPGFQFRKSCKHVDEKKENVNA